MREVILAVTFVAVLGWMGMVTWGMLQLDHAIESLGSECVKTESFHGDRYDCIQEESDHGR